VKYIITFPQWFDTHTYTQRSWIIFPRNGRAPKLRKRRKPVRWPALRDNRKLTQDGCGVETFTVHSLSSCSCTGGGGGSPGVRCWTGSYGVCGGQAHQRWRGQAGWSGWGQRTCVLRSAEPSSRWHLLRQNGAYGVTCHLQTGETGVIDRLTHRM